MQTRKGIRSSSDVLARALARARPRRCHCPPAQLNTGEQLLKRSNRLKLDMMRMEMDGETRLLCEFEVHGEIEFASAGDTGAAALLRCLLRDFRTAERKVHDEQEGGAA